MSKQPGATQCPSCGKGNQSAQCWNCGCDWSLPSEIAPNDVAVQELRNIVEAKRFNRANFPDDTEFANWAQSRCRFILGRIEASRSATGPSTDDSRDARRYRTIREHGIPCSAADDCGSCTGDELDAQIDDAITNPEKYDV